mmetsp:Transcript_111998/g.327530  ORF Transcript_111998/g.327530 Transcript_111998/m.327530 type:complete len:663 (+) Transcript_111998:36-2024(+)
MDLPQQYDPLVTRDSTLETASESPDKSKLLRTKLEDIEAKEAQLSQRLEDINSLWKRDVAPIQAELVNLRGQKTELTVELHLAEHDGEGAKPPGPANFKWVDSSWFFGICTLVIIVNVVVMILETRSSSPAIGALGHVFLIWYIFEIVAKAIYHQRQLFFGELRSVWSNWLDLFIVLTSIIDQWLLPLLSSGSAVHFGASYLRLLRLLRLSRFMKLVGVFLQSDLSWADGPRFETFIGAVISVNAVVMGLEQDIEWKGWLWVEHMFLLIYFFELSLKLKRWGVGFFTQRDAWVWNNLDFLIVSGGVLDMWAMPAYHYILFFIDGNPHEDRKSGIIATIRIARILRVFRLVRLVKNIKPLYRLMLGVAEGVGAMFWVLVLASITLYAMAIVFTSLIKDGYLFGDDVPEEAQAMFGTVLHSMYALFKLMNDDQSVVDSITVTPLGMMLFVTSMIISNWALLAVLTSVVSDNMIASSLRQTSEEADLTAAESRRRIHSQLEFIFEMVDKDRIGIIDEAEWTELMNDSEKCRMLEVASLRPAESLRDLFQCLADFDEKKRCGRLKDSPHRMLEYRLLIEEIESECTPADRKSILALMVRMGAMDRRVEQRLDYLIKTQPGQQSVSPQFEARHHHTPTPRSLRSRSVAGVPDGLSIPIPNLRASETA